MTALTEEDKQELTQFYYPDIEEVLSEIFKDWKFEFLGEPIMAQDVFSDIGFMPLIVHATEKFYTNNFEEAIPRGVFEVLNEDPESSVFGMKSSVDLKLAKPHQAVLLTMIMSNVCFEMFGIKPCHINLDRLFEWARNPEAQRQGLPHLSENI